MAPSNPAHPIEAAARRPSRRILLEFMASVILFCGLLQQIISTDPIVSLDSRIETSLAAVRTPFLAQVFLFITQFGQAPFVTILIAIICIFLSAKKNYAYIAGLLIAAIGSSTMNSLIKISIARARPSGIIPFLHEQSYSFPSGHATTAVALYGFITYLLLKRLPNRMTQRSAFVACMLIILIIGFSRLYLGVHFPSDVLGGYLLGFLWLLIGIALTGFLEQRHARTSERH